MFIKYKILVNGLNPIGIYTLDGFTMKKGTFEERMFDMKYNQDNIGINLNMNLYLISCLNDYEKLTYNYFESNELIEIEVSNKTTKNNLSKVIDNNKKIIDRAMDLEKKIRIIFNIPILFQSINIAANSPFANLIPFLFRRYSSFSFRQRIFPLQKPDTFSSERNFPDFNPFLSSHCRYIHPD